MLRSIIKKLVKVLIPLIPFLKTRIFLLRLIGYEIGKNVYIPADFRISDLKTRQKNLVIGNRVSVGPSVLIITDSSPNNSRLIKKFPLVSGFVTIDDDTWLGAGVIVLPNVTIGKCCIIGAGSVVNRDIPPYSIAVGTPAKVIKKIAIDDV